MESFMLKMLIYRGFLYILCTIFMIFAYLCIGFLDVRDILRNVCDSI